MCKVAYQRIKELRPNVTVLGAAAVSIPLPYFEDIFKHGGLDYMDAIVIHPYRDQPEGVEREIAELRALVRKYNHGKEKPLWATEYGMGGTDPREPARYLVRMSALMRSQNVDHMFWYLMRDFNEFKGMGLIHDGQDPAAPTAPAPAYAAMAAMVRLLHDARFVERDAFSKYTRTYVLKFLQAGGDEVHVCWATHPGKIRVEAERPLVRVDLMGNSQPLEIDAGAAVLDVDTSPFYLVGKARKVAEVSTGTTIVADLIEDYAKTQGGYQLVLRLYGRGRPRFQALSDCRNALGRALGRPSPLPGCKPRQPASAGQRRKSGLGSAALEESAAGQGADQRAFRSRPPGRRLHGDRAGRWQEALRATCRRAEVADTPRFRPGCGSEGGNLDRLCRHARPRQQR